MTPDLNDLRLFVQVARAQGYAPASRASGVPRATLSRRIAALEQQLGLRLIERSSRSFRLTGPGQQLFDQGQRAIAEADAAFAALEQGGSAPQGQVRFSVAPSVLQLRLSAILSDYLAAFPRVSLQIEATNRRVDLLREGFDFAIRAREAAAAPLDQVILPFATLGNVLVLAPQLAKDLGASLADSLTRLPVLAWGGTGQPAVWRLQDAQGRLQRVSLTPRLMVEDMAALRLAVLEGLGLALLPQIMVAEDLAAGRLQRVDLDLVPQSGRIHAVHLGKKGMRPVVRHLLDYLAKAYGQICATEGHRADMP